MTSISYIYIIWSESGMVKVGKSDDPKKRLSSIKNGHPFSCKITHTFPIANDDPYIIERKCHEALSKTFQKVREWYKASVDDIFEIT